MTRRDVFEMALKVVAVMFAVVWVLRMIGLLTMSSGGVSGSETRSYASFVIGMIVVVIVIAGFLVLFLMLGARRLAHMLMSEDPEPVLECLRRDQAELFLVLLKLAGVVMLFLGLFSLVSRLWLDLWYLHQGGRLTTYHAGVYAAEAIRLALGLYLFLGGEALARLAFRRTGEAAEVERGEAAPDALSRSWWTRPLFELGVRLAGTVFVVWYSCWFLRALLLQWFMPLRWPGFAHAGVDDLLCAVVVLAFCLYLILGAGHLGRKIYPVAGPPPEGSDPVG